eukprot:scaffold64389_cov30-Phaeocystis_antarctica.AAC.1
MRVRVRVRVRRRANLGIELHDVVVLTKAEHMPHGVLHDVAGEQPPCIVPVVAGVGGVREVATQVGPEVGARRCRRRRRRGRRRRRR